MTELEEANQRIEYLERLVAGAMVTLKQTTDSLNGLLKAYVDWRDKGQETK